MRLSLNRATMFAGLLLAGVAVMGDGTRFFGLHAFTRFRRTNRR